MKYSRTVLVVVATLGLFACGSSSSSSSSTTTTQSVCGAKSDLQESVKALAEPSTLTGGKSGITAAMDTVKKDLDALGTAAKADLKPEVDAVKKSLDNLKTSLGQLGDGAIGTGLSAVGDDITKVATATSNLVDAITTRCPSN